MAEFLRAELKREMSNREKGPSRQPKKNGAAASEKAEKLLAKQESEKKRKTDAEIKQHKAAAAKVQSQVRPTLKKLCKVLDDFDVVKASPHYVMLPPHFQAEGVTGTPSPPP